MTVAEADQVLKIAVADALEDAFRAGHAAAEETLGAHGSEHLLSSIEASWERYAADNALVSA